MAEASFGGGYGFDRLDKAPKTGQKFARVSGREPLLCVVLSEQPYVYEGHYWEGCMWPHLPDAVCKPCKFRIGRAPHAVFSIWVPQVQQVQALDLPEHAAVRVFQLSEERGGLRGLALDLQKADGNYRGRLIVRLDEYARVCKSLPAPHDVKAVVEESWRRLDLE